MRKLLFLFGLSLLILTGCGKKENSSTPTAKNSRPEKEIEDLSK